MKKLIPAAALVLVLVAVGACSAAPADEEAADSADTEHVWKDQTNALDKARDLENTLTDAEKKRREQLDGDGT